MHESITVAKVRKATTVKIPAGGWVLISTPDEPFLTHINRRAELIKDGFVNEDFSTVLIGRLADSHPVARFMTKSEKAEAEETHKANEKNLAEQNVAAIELRKKADATAQEKRAAEHKAKIAEINKENDSIRTRDANATPKKQIQLETDDSGESDSAELESKSLDELMAVVKSLNDDTKRKEKIMLPDKATKEQVAAAIAEATKAEEPGFFKKWFGK